MLRRLIITMAAMTLIAGAAAQSPAEQSRVLSGVTVTCTGAAPSWSLGCFAEKRLFTVGPVELALGVDARAVLTGTLDDASLAPYGVLAVYMPDWSAWAELRMPSLGVPVIGTSDWLRVGFTLQIP